MEIISLYKNIKNRRKELKMSQTELAEKMGYSDKSMISKIEKGVINLPQSKIMDFARVLDMDAGDLMGLDGTVPEDESELFRIYHNLNDEGKEKLLEHARLLSGANQYKKHNKHRVVEEEA